MMTVANCAIDAPINIWNGHSDGMSRRFEIDYDYCKPCGICVSKCPCGAFRMEPEDR
jgi:Pyruvate/2-oxoacid:ferredoxin oxidoreductase delta subunit